MRQLFFITLLLSPFAYAADSILVSNLDDAGPGSLRDAIADIDPAGTITFNAALFGQTISLTSGELVVDKEMTIDASNLIAPMIISAGELSRVMSVTEIGSLTMRSVTLTEGRTGDPGGGLAIAGGAQLFDCAVTECIGGNGGGIHSSSLQPVMLKRCLIENNRGRRGGGMRYARVVDLDGCTFRGNEASRTGGGLHRDGGGLIVNCLFVGNSAPGANYTGGGIWSAGDYTITGCTITGNSAGRTGGGVYGQDDTTIQHCTIVGNTASRGGGVFSSDPPVVRSSIIADNGEEDFDGQVLHFSSSHNVLETVSGLMALGDYGGDTLTMRPEAGAMTLVDQGEVAPPVIVDGRNQARVFGAASDIGAVEYQGEAGEALVFPDSDPDNDGTPNLLEIAQGRDPLVADADSLKVLRFQSDEFESLLSFGFDRVAMEDFEVSITMTTDLVNFMELFSDAVIRETFPVDGVLTIPVVVTGTDKMLYRMEVEPK